MAGWIRIAFATLAIVDRLLLHLDLDLFLSPTTGLLPISQEKRGLFGILSLLRFVTRDSRCGGVDVGAAYLWSMHYFGLLNSVLLLLGVAPRLNAFALFVNTCSFQNANWMIVDGGTTGLGPMARLYNFHLLFLPLHHITVYDGFGFGFGFGRKGKNTDKSQNDSDHDNNDNDNDNDTWPMWTVWLWQWETILILLGAWVGKVAYGTRWIDGTAMYYVLHCTDECIGFFNPDILFNRALTSKIATWSALVIEGISPLTIWRRGFSRKVTLVLVTMLFFGMDISMTMHTFEWYGVLGWYLFLIERDDLVLVAEEETSSSLSSSTSSLSSSSSSSLSSSSSTSTSMKETTPAAVSTTSKPIVDFTEAELMKELARRHSGPKKSKQRSRTPFWRIGLHGSVFFFVLGLAFNMAFPLKPILTMTPTWFSEKADPFLQRKQYMTRFYAFPIASALGIHQDIWSLYSGDYGGHTSKLSINAFLTDGTIMTWRSPNWQDLGRWEHKRLYNHMAYYKHLPYCSFNEDGECEEWYRFIDMLAETFYNDVKDKFVKLELWQDIEFPPEYPENVGWWDSLKQPLIKESVRKLHTWHVRGNNNDMEEGGGDDYDYDDDEEDWGEEEEEWDEEEEDWEEEEEHSPPAASWQRDEF